VIGPRPRPTRPPKRSGLTFEACGIISVIEILWSPVGREIVERSRTCWTWLQHWMGPVLQFPPSRGMVVARETAGRARVKTVEKCIVWKVYRKCIETVGLSLFFLLVVFLLLYSNPSVYPKIEWSYLWPLNNGPHWKMITSMNTYSVLVGIREPIWQVPH